MFKYIRILPKKQYFRSLGRFSSLAFRNLKGGISIIRKSCISDTGSPICRHLKNYYKSVDDSPYVIWIFKKDILPQTVTIEQKDSDSGDKCHYDIKGLNKGTAKRVFTDNFDLLEDGKICNNDHPRKFIDKDLKFFKNTA